MYMRWLMFFGFKEYFNNYSVKSNICDGSCSLGLKNILIIIP